VITKILRHSISGNNIKKLFASSLFRQTIAYGLTDAVNKALPFILFPILATVLTPVDYGVLSNYFVIVQLVTIISALSTTGSLISIWYKRKRELSTQYIYNEVVVISAICLVLLVLVLLFSPVIEKYTSVNLFWQLTTVLIAYFSNITALQLTVWRLEEQPFKYGGYQILQSLALTASTYILVIVLRWNWEGRTWSQFAGITLFGILSFIILIKKKNIRFRYSSANVKDILMFGLPLLPHGMSVWLKTGVDKLLLTNFADLHENGLYSTALTFTSIVFLLLFSFNNAYNPFLFKKLSQTDTTPGAYMVKKKLVKMTYTLFAGLVLFVFIAYLFSKYFIIFFLNDSYELSLKYLPPLMITAFFQGCYLLVVNYIFYARKTRKLGMITFTGSLVQMALSWFLLTTFGASGIAWSSVIVAFFNFILVWILSAKTYDMPWLFFLTKQPRS